MKIVGVNLGSLLRLARERNALTQAALAAKVGVTQATISNWEKGKIELDRDTMAKLKSVLGTDFSAADKEGFSEGGSVLKEWLSRARQQAGLTAAQLAERSGLSMQTIYNIESGRAQNLRQTTIQSLEKALQNKLDPEFAEEVLKASTVEGIGEFTDFDPHDPRAWPHEAGVYVFYDITDRPIYVGMGEDIAARIKDHEEKFWFKRPIVQSASFIVVKDKTLRRQIETILIKFLKSNAIINKQGVEREG